MKPYIMDPYTSEMISPNLLFGRESDIILAACRKVYEDWMEQYKGCYLPKYPKNVNSLRAYIEWLKEKPDEQAKIEASRAEWEREHNRQFRIIYGIAKRHGFYLKQREYYVEQWAIYRNYELIAIIHCA